MGCWGAALLHSHQGEVLGFPEQWPPGRGGGSRAVMVTRRLWEQGAPCSCLYTRVLIQEGDEPARGGAAWVGGGGL